MSNAADQTNFPTMIIPKGTEIKLNTQGQLSIKTPGNLVIQNSGTYSELESTNGSIRIEDNVSVEAIHVKAAQACFIQGTLTAWKVHAKRIALEDRAKAYIMLQESEQLDLAKTSRLVGNFATEKEIYLMLGKFTQQLKQLPGSVDMHGPEDTNLRSVAAIPMSTQPARAMTELPLPLRQALTVIESELNRPELDGHSGQALREVSFHLKEKNLQMLGMIYRDAFSEVSKPSDMLRSAFELLDSYFKSQK